MKLKARKLIQKFSDGFSRTLYFFVGFINCVRGTPDWVVKSDKTVNTTTNVSSVWVECRFCGKRKGDHKTNEKAEAEERAPHQKG